VLERLTLIYKKLILITTKVSCVMSKTLESKNWIPDAFQEAARYIAKDAVRTFVKSNLFIGLGSGPMAAAIVREIGKLPNDIKSTLRCIASSTQIKRIALDGGLKIVDENLIPTVDIVFDGADQVDSRFNMIKGGGGALLKEKVLHSAARTIIIAAESFKYVESFNMPVPVEVHPFALYAVKRKLEIENRRSKPKLRMLNEGYPYVTENGNFILDIVLSSLLSLVPDVSKKEAELRNVPGIVEVGLFTKHATVYYKANQDNSFKILKPLR
jgi:ribose 5-phosphate isomerase A